MNNLRKTEFNIHCIGTLAMDMLSTEKIATVFGVTSRGIYMKFVNNKMIFLSFENYRGSLTANLSGGSQTFLCLSLCLND